MPTNKTTCLCNLCFGIEWNWRFRKCTFTIFLWSQHEYCVVLLLLHAFVCVSDRSWWQTGIEKYYATLLGGTDSTRCAHKILTDIPIIHALCKLCMTCAHKLCSQSHFFYVFVIECLGVFPPRHFYLGRIQCILCRHQTLRSSVKCEILLPMGFRIFGISFTMINFFFLLFFFFSFFSQMK